MDCEIYLDADNDRHVWDAPKLIIKLDSLVKVVLNNTDVMNSEGSEPTYDLIMSVEREPTLSKEIAGLMRAR